MHLIFTFIKKLAGEISKNSPVVLTGLAVTGVVSTVIVAIRATPKAIAIIDDETYKRYEEALDKEKEQNKEELSFPEWLGLDTDTYTWKDCTNQLTKKEIVKYTWKCYIPTVAVGAVTIACIIGAHNVHLRRNVALASLYSLTESAFKEYQSKVVETIGKNKELKVRNDISEDLIKQNPTKDTEIIFTGKGETLCYDAMSGRYFKTDLDKVRRIQNNLNRELMSEMFISLNEFYDELGLSHIKLGEESGWHVNNALIDIVFSAQLTDTDEPCLVLNYEVVPRRLYD